MAVLHLVKETFRYNHTPIHSVPTWNEVLTQNCPITFPVYIILSGILGPQQQQRTKNIELHTSLDGVELLHSGMYFLCSVFDFVT